MGKIILMDGLHEPLKRMRDDLVGRFGDQEAAIDAVMNEARQKFSQRALNYAEFCALCTEVNQFHSLQGINGELRPAIQKARKELLIEIGRMFKVSAEADARSVEDPNELTFDETKAQYCDVTEKFLQNEAQYTAGVSPTVAQYLPKIFEMMRGYSDVDWKESKNQTEEIHKSNTTIAVFTKEVMRKIPNHRIIMAMADTTWVTAIKGLRVGEDWAPVMMAMALHRQKVERHKLADQGDINFLSTAQGPDPTLKFDQIGVGAMVAFAIAGKKYAQTAVDILREMNVQNQTQLLRSFLSEGEKWLPHFQRLNAQVGPSSPFTLDEAVERLHILYSSFASTSGASGQIDFPTHEQFVALAEKWVEKTRKQQPEYKSLSSNEIAKSFKKIFDKMAVEGRKHFHDKKDIFDTWMHYNTAMFEGILKTYCKDKFENRLDLLPLEEWMRNTNDPEQRWPDPSPMDTWGFEFFKREFFPLVASLKTRLRPFQETSTAPGTLTKKEVLDAIDSVRDGVDIGSIPLSSKPPRGKVNANWNDAIFGIRAFVVKNCPDVLQFKTQIGPIRDAVKRGLAASDSERDRKENFTFLANRLLPILDSLEGKLSAEPKKETKLTRVDFFSRFKNAYSSAWNRSETMLDKKVPVRRKNVMKSLPISLVDLDKIFTRHCPDPVTSTSSLEPLVNEIRIHVKTRELTMPDDVRQFASEASDIIRDGIDASLSTICAGIHNQDTAMAALSVRKGISENGTEITGGVAYAAILPSLANAGTAVQNTMRDKYKERKPIQKEVLVCCDMVQNTLRAVAHAYPQDIDELGFRALQIICGASNVDAPINNVNAKAEFLKSLQLEFAPIFTMCRDFFKASRSRESLPKEVVLPEEAGPMAAGQVVEYLLQASHHADKLCGVGSDVTLDDILRKTITAMLPEIIEEAEDLSGAAGYLAGRSQAIDWHKSSSRTCTREVNLQEFDIALGEICNKLQTKPFSLWNFLKREQGHGIEKEQYQNKLLKQWGAVKTEAIQSLPSKAQIEAGKFFAEAERGIRLYIRKECPTKISDVQEAALFGFCTEMINTSRIWNVDRAGISEEEQSVFYEILEKKFLPFFDTTPAYPLVALFHEPARFTPQENPVPPFWSNYVRLLAHNQFRAFIQECDSLTYSIADEELLQAICNQIFTAFSTITKNLDARVTDACTRNIPQITDAQPQSKLLYEAVVEAILDSVDVIPKTIPEQLYSALNNAMLYDIDTRFKEQDLREDFLSGPPSFWVPSENPKADLGQSLRKHLPPPETKLQKFQRGKDSVRDLCVAAMTDCLINAILAKGRQTVSTPEGSTYCPLSRSDFSWEWVDAIASEVGLAVNKVSAELQTSETASDLLSKSFTGARAQVFVARAGSSVEQVLSRLGVPQDVCTAVRGVRPDFSSAFDGKNETVPVRGRIHERLFAGRERAPLFEREKGLLEQFCRIVLVPGKGVESQLNERRQQIDDIAASCNEHCHAGEPCRTRATLWNEILRIGADVLEKKSDAPATTLLTDLPVAEHLRELQKIVLENQQWIDLITRAERRRNTIGYLEHVFLWHQQASDYLQQSVVLGPDAGPSVDAYLNARKVMIVRTSGVIIAAPNGKESFKLEVDSPKLKAVFRSLDDLDRSGKTTESSTLILGEASAQIADLQKIAAELERLQASVGQATGQAINAGSLQSEADYQERIEAYLESQKSFLAEVPQRAADVTANLHGLIAVLQKAAAASTAAISLAGDQVTAATEAVASGVKDRSPDSVMVELSFRLTQAQAADERAKLHQVQFPCTEWKAAAEKMTQSLQSSVLAVLPDGTVLPPVQNSFAAIPPDTDTEGLLHAWTALQKQAQNMIDACDEIFLNQDELKRLVGGLPDRATALRQLKKQDKQSKKDQLKIDELKAILEKVKAALHPTDPPQP